MRVLDLFAGAGGFSVGAHALTDDVWGIELDEDAVATQRAAGMACEQADITTLDPQNYGALGDHLHLHASPPCQTFSAAGKGDGRKHLDTLSMAVRDILSGGEVGDDIDLSDVPEGSLLVLEPARWIHALRPDSVSMEQVRSVLPIWEAYAEGLEALGYDTWAALLYSEQYGVPQTRTRAWLGASLHKEPTSKDADLGLVLDLGDRSTVVSGAQSLGDETLSDPHLVPVGKIHPPKPTHSKYHVRKPERLDANVLPWVSMAEALGWGDDDLAGFPRRADNDDTVTIDGVNYRARDFRQGHQPAFGLTEKARSWTHMMQGGPGGEGRPRTADHPAPTQPAIGTATAPHDPDNHWHAKENKAARVAATHWRQSSHTRATTRALDEPAGTMLFGHASADMRFTDAEDGGYAKINQADIDRLG